jgi:hypothetical protein
MPSLGSHPVVRAGSLLPAFPVRPATPTLPARPATGRAVSAFLTAIGGESARRRLHALHPRQPGQEAAVTGFALALALSLERARDAPLLWVQDRQALAEAGRPYGHGLAALGLDPARLVVVAVKGAMNALAAAEMGLEEAGLAGVLVDLPPRLPSDMLRLGKRLSLRAQARETPCFLLHAGVAPVEAPVATRWQVGSANGLANGRMPLSGRASERARSNFAHPPDLTTAFDLTLIKNRFGALGRFHVRWQPALEPEIAARKETAAPKELCHVPRFAFFDAPLPEPVVADAADRSAGTAQTGAVLPWPTAQPDTSEPTAPWSTAA